MPSVRVHDATQATAAETVRKVDVSSVTWQAFQLLHITFVVAPIVMGVDKFFDRLVDWDKYLAPWVARSVPANDFMMAVGVVEIIAGLIVAFKPRIGAYIVGCWLLGIVINLLTYSGFYDIALRDFGLALGAFALGRLAEIYDGQPVTKS
jgi:hypothetical protein